MVDLPFGGDDFGDFGDEGLFIKSFTPSTSITNDLSNDTGNTTVIRFGSCLEKAVDCNMILTLTIKFKAQHNQIYKVKK